MRHTLPPVCPFQHIASLCRYRHKILLLQGINPQHEEFSDASGKSRVGTAYSYDTSAYNDCNGHGSHITATMAGLNYGLAKDAIIHSGKPFLPFPLPVPMQWQLQIQP